MSAFTLACDLSDLDAQRPLVDAFARALGGETTWRLHARLHRGYALVEVPGAHEATELRSILQRGIVFEAAIIVLAVYPSLPEALPPLYQALCGPGGPQGLLACESIDGGALLAWDPRRTSATLIVALIDLELRRFGAARTCELLAPLPLATLSAIAADGLGTPEIQPDRVLEYLIGVAG